MLTSMLQFGTFIALSLFFCACASSDSSTADRGKNPGEIVASVDLGSVSSFTKAIEISADGWSAKLEAVAAECLRRSHLLARMQPSEDASAASPLPISLTLRDPAGQTLRDGWEVCVGANSSKCKAQLEWNWNDCGTRELVVVLNNATAATLSAELSLSVFDPLD